jgi:HK97 family phage portal protein
VNCLADTAWACLDKNSSILASLPVYKTKGGQVVDPEGWMTNPDPRVYSSWYEFAKQLFWDYQGCGEAFVYATDYFSSGWPMFMRIIPPPMVNIEMNGSERRYSVGSVDITDDVLHIRYKSQVGDAHGVGPLDVAGARLTASCVLARYVSTMTSAPPPFMTLETDQLLNATDAQDVLDQWMTSRATNAGAPAVLDAGITLNTHQMNARDMALLELAQFTDARICVLLGVPPFLMALPTGDSMTYSNVEQVFEYHDRSQLRTEAVAVMTALSNWALPRGQNVELDREEYSRPPLTERVNAYKTLVELGAMDASEIRPIERTFFAAAPAVDSPLVAVNGDTP